jgi:hypothetical protein
MLLTAGIADLLPWGYHGYGAEPDYTNFEEGGYWGIAPRLRALHLSDRVVDHCGDWKAMSIENKDEEQAQQEIPVTHQTYIDPYGVRRRVRGISLTTASFTNFELR